MQANFSSIEIQVPRVPQTDAEAQRLHLSLAQTLDAVPSLLDGKDNIRITHVEGATRPTVTLKSDEGKLALDVVEEISGTARTVSYFFGNCQVSVPQINISVAHMLGTNAAAPSLPKNELAVRKAACAVSAFVNAPGNRGHGYN